MSRSNSAAENIDDPAAAGRAGFDKGAGACRGDHTTRGAYPVAGATTTRGVTAGRRVMPGCGESGLLFAGAKQPRPVGRFGSRPCRTAVRRARSASAAATAATAAAAFRWSLSFNNARNCFAGMPLIVGRDGPGGNGARLIVGSGSGSSPRFRRFDAGARMAPVTSDALPLRPMTTPCVKALSPPSTRSRGRRSPSPPPAGARPARTGRWSCRPGGPTRPRRTSPAATSAGCPTPRSGGRTPG